MPGFLDTLFASGRIIDLILVLVAVEFVVLALWPRLRGRLSVWDAAALIAPGVCLMLTVKSALVQDPHMKTAALLAAALLFHLLDVARRRKGPARDQS
jgi:hypothetical protein